MGAIFSSALSSCLLAVTDPFGAGQFPIRAGGVGISFRVHFGMLSRFWFLLSYMHSIRLTRTLFSIDRNYVAASPTTRSSTMFLQPTWCASLFSSRGKLFLFCRKNTADNTSLPSYSSKRTFTVLYTIRCRFYTPLLLRHHRRRIAQ